MILLCIGLWAITSIGSTVLSLYLRHLMLDVTWGDIGVHVGVSLIPIIGPIIIVGAMVDCLLSDKIAIRKKGE